MNTKQKKDLLKGARDGGSGIVRLAPAWVPRSFLVPGGRLKLAPQDIYALGAHRGGIDERWLASTTNADNGPGTLDDEGLSYIVVQDNKKILLKEAIELLGDNFLGKTVMEKYGGWMVLTKFFDNLGPIPHHLHQKDEHAAKVGRKGKPEAYYFPPQLNFRGNNFPYTFFGLEPGTTKEDIKRCLENWEEGDNGILYLSKAYKLKPGTGWNVPGGILHAPGSYVTYEPQKASDVFALFQSMVEGKYVPREMLVKDVPKKLHNDLDYIISMIDWEENVDPEFVKHHYLEPKPVDDMDTMSSKGYVENWVTYGSEEFSTKELTVFPDRKVKIQDKDAYGLILVQGRGTIGKMAVETPTMIRFGELTKDELFVSYETARGGVTIRNTSESEDLVMLKHFGPGNPDTPI
ncbi:MAG: hypothetical protein HYY56_07195 [Candidatus Omnitrophica bacterium]|nr:hypothetical protein [Candidatus Omnitrophota bacterium]